MMSTEADIETDAEPTPERPEELAGELGAAIADTAEYEKFVETKSTVEQSPDAQEAVREFERLRDEFMQARQMGEATQEDLKTLQGAQQQLHEVPEMAAFLEAQEALDARLERINETIATNLAIDFGDRIGSCCQD